jgi:hypothetical protein
MFNIPYGLIFNSLLNNDMQDFFCDEAWFHLSGFVNSQNYRTWSAYTPHNILEVPLHTIKISACVAMSRRLHLF